MADDITFYDEIEAYCSALSVIAGNAVDVHVSTPHARFDMHVERWGSEREVVFATTGLSAGDYPAPQRADSHGCDWPVAFQIPTGPEWASGFYLLTLTAHGATPGRDVAHSCFVVRPAALRQRALLVLGTNTWNAYNTWGGASLYTGGHQVSFRRPWCRGLLDRPRVERDDRKARPVRFREEADADGEIFQAYRNQHGYSPAIGSTGWFTHERRFVEWAEAGGYQFDYAVSSDFDADPTLLYDYELVLGVGHDEYWTKAGRDAVDAHIARGGNYVSMSGNTMFWQVRLVDSHDAPGLDHMIGHKYAGHSDDPVVAAGDRSTMSGLWCDPLVGRPEWSTLGAGSVFGLYHRFGQATPRGTGGYTVFRNDHWMFADTGLRYGDVVGIDDGVVGYETVGCPVQLDDTQLPVVRETNGMPEIHEIVAMALSSNLGMGDYPKSISALNDQGDLEFLAERYYGDTSAANLAKVRHGNSVMVVCQPAGSTGGEVVTIGSTDWVFGLAVDRFVGQISANIMDRYLS